MSFEIMPTPLVIVGAGGHGREVLDIVEAVNGEQPKFEFLGFLDDNEDETGILRRRGLPRLGPVARLPTATAAYVIAIGSPRVRLAIDSMSNVAAQRAAVLVHPSVTIGSDVQLGRGSILAAGARVTTNVHLGRHVHLNVAATVAHDCRLGDYVSLSPGVHLSGRVTLSEGVFVGTGAVVNPGCRLGEWAVVGAGAVVVDDVAPGTTVAGVPARRISSE